MSLETYATRTMPWAPDDCSILSREASEFSCVAIAAGVMRGNKAIKAAIFDAKLADALDKIKVDVRRAWPIVPKGPQC